MHGCWIDLYESPTCVGERRRVAGPMLLDGVVWRRFGDDDRVSLRAGPRARIRLVSRDGGALDVAPSTELAGVAAHEIVEVRIEFDAIAGDAEPPAGVVTRSRARRAVRREIRPTTRLDADDQAAEQADAASGGVD